MITFLTPALLWGLLVLPVIWGLLRIFPPPVRHEQFGGLVLLQSVIQPTQKNIRHKVPWWIWLIRLLLIAAIIVGFAGPVYQSAHDTAIELDKRTIIVEDGGWASVVNWEERQNYIDALLRQSPDIANVDFISLSTNDIRKLSTSSSDSNLYSIKPQPWIPDRTVLRDILDDDTYKTVIWLTDGFVYDEAVSKDLLQKKNKNLHIVQPDKRNSAQITLGRVHRKTATSLDVNVYTTFPDIFIKQQQKSESASLFLQTIDTNGRVLQTRPLPLAPDAKTTTVTFDLPVQLANKVATIKLANAKTPAHIALADQRDRRILAGMIDLTGEQDLQTTSPLLSDQHYIQQALGLTQSLVILPLDALLSRGVDIIFLPGSTVIDKQQTKLLEDWVTNNGGVLVQFADETLTSDALLPVRMLRDVRTLGSTLSWETPQQLAAFDESSPFAKILLPENDKIVVNRQMLADPSAPRNNSQVWATLEDGTPLVTAKENGNGLVVFFHVAANPSWSTLPLSGVFPSLLEEISRTFASAISTKINTHQKVTHDDKWYIVQGVETNATLKNIDLSLTIDEQTFASFATAESPAGFYRSTQNVSENLRPRHLLPENKLPLDVLDFSNISHVNTYTMQQENIVYYKKWFLLTAFILFLLDVMITSLMNKKKKNALAVGVLLIGMCLSHHTEAQNIDNNIATAATSTTFAYIQTGDRDIDRLSKAGLATLGRTLTARTSVEPSTPQRVTLDQDLRAYSLVYWPINTSSTISGLSVQQVKTVSSFITAGGLLLIDTQGKQIEPAQLRSFFTGIFIPPLFPVQQNHVLHRTYYLLDRLSGRFDHNTGSPAIWMSQPALDGTSSVIIGDVDWSGAWAQDDSGFPLLPVNFEQQENALRTGVNIVMYAFTGTYKEDQIHVGALLERMEKETQ